MGLDLAPGKEFSEEVRRNFLSTVHPTMHFGHFTMVVAFGRTSFKLDEDSAAVALESITGGRCDALKFLIYVIVFSVSRLLTRKLVFCLLSAGSLFLQSSSVIFIFGIMAGLNGSMSSSFGRNNARRNGL